MILSRVRDFFQDGKLFQALVWPITPMTYLKGFEVDGVEYQLSRYIWGLPGDVVFSRTLKCKDLFVHSFYNVHDKSYF